MTNDAGDGPERYVEAIRRSGLSIYDPIEIGDPALWIPTPELEVLLNQGLAGISLRLPNKSRSKAEKVHVCRVLGYPVPTSFKRTKPRFPGQFFDVYGQKHNNLQVWNARVEPNRRYVVIRYNDDSRIIKVKVVTGDTLVRLDKTGTLTQKFQARLKLSDLEAELISEQDTDLLRPLVRPGVDLGEIASPVDNPAAGQLLPIAEIFHRLRGLVGEGFADRGYDQERNRSADLHQLVCQHLGYTGYRDDGRFPDVRHQLLEVKLQTALTIDLGLVCPDSIDTRELPLDISLVEGRQIRPCDVRYVIFYGETDGENVRLTHMYLTTGELFFTRFPQFQGKVINKKLQIHLPADFFDD